MVPAVPLFPNLNPIDSRALDILKRQFVHLRRMVHDLLDLARVRECKLDVQKQPRDLPQVVDDAISSTSWLFERPHHALTVTLPDEPLWVDVDPTRLEQVRANLLTKAAKYTDDAASSHFRLRTKCRNDFRVARVLWAGRPY